MSFIFGMAMTYWTMKNIESQFENKEADLATLLVFNALSSMFFGWLANEYMVL